MNAKTKEKLPSLIGAGLAFLTFVIYAAVPSILYGGYVGLILDHALFGPSTEQTVMGTIIAGGGMVLGVVATLFLFLVAGAVLGNVVWFLARPVVRGMLGTTTEMEPEHVTSEN